MARASSCAICRGPRRQLREIPPFEFENWAVIALGGIPNKTQVGDMGIDGRIYPYRHAASTAAERRAGELRLHGRLVSDPGQAEGQGRPTGHRQVRGRHDADKRKKGFFVSFDFSSDATREIGAFFKRSGKVIVPFTVREILDDRIAMKLA